MPEIRETDSETGLSVDVARRLRELEARARVIKLDGEGRVSIGDAQDFPLEVVTAGLTVVSRRGAKRNVRALEGRDLEVTLPEPKRYEIGGKTLIGFLEDELPEAVRTEGGYSLIALIAVLVHKVNRLERVVQELREIHAQRAE
ncbi:MAG: hypothetical protein NZ733_00165 [Aigarchaeota archaeon]|nr:hypothetical protein [Aigarchaeota archaeon]MCX8203103.1 hypothetical protein [Nitrososphaeria archaeon]